MHRARHENQDSVRVAYASYTSAKLTSAPSTSLLLTDANLMMSYVSKDSDEIPALLDATAELNRLFKKFDARQWKVYVNTEYGKVLR